LKQLDGIQFEKDVELHGKKFDYYLPSKKLAIDITRNNILKNRIKDFNEIKGKESPQFKAIFISEIDLFERMRAGFDSCKTWLNNLLTSGEAYQSSQSDKGPFF